MSTMRPSGILTFPLKENASPKCVTLSLGDEWMRFFTQEWADGELSDEDFEQMSSDYESYLLQLSLPVGGHRLAQMNLHDGLVREVSGSTESLRLLLTTGDLQNGYRRTTICYNGGDCLLASFNLKHIETDTEVIADELDAVGDGFVHRLLFADGKEVHIPFRDVSVTEEPAAEREA